MRRRAGRVAAASGNLAMIDLFIGVLGGVVVLAAAFSAMLRSQEAVTQKTYITAEALFTVQQPCEIRRSGRPVQHWVDSCHFVLRGDDDQVVIDTEQTDDSGRFTWMKSEALSGTAGDGTETCEVRWWLLAEPIQPGRYDLTASVKINPAVWTEQTVVAWGAQYRYLTSGPEASSWQVFYLEESQDHPVYGRRPGATNGARTLCVSQTTQVTIRTAD